MSAERAAAATEHRGGPLPAPIGRALEPLYRFGINWRNRRFNRGRGVVRLPIPVISVGNLSVGGTGKTPMVTHIIATLLRESPSSRPSIAMRGYRPRGAPRPGTSRAATPDETDAYRRRFEGGRVMIVAQPDRAAGLKRLLAGPEDERPTCVVLDDGFQHRRLARDLDIVLIDASRPPLRDRLLPAGWLREPVASLQRADALVLTHAELVEPSQLARIEAELHAAVGKSIDAITRHVWTALIVDEDREERTVPLDWLLGKRIVGACAIGNPHGFVHSLKAHVDDDGNSGGRVADVLILPDHDPFEAAAVQTLLGMADNARADAIVVTDKDWSKLRRLDPRIWGGRPVARPVLEMVFQRGGPELDRRVLAVAESRRS